MSNEKHLLIERAEHSLWLTLDRANKANALTVAMAEGAAAALNEAAVDESVRVVVVRGAGHRAFCAGIDVREEPADGDMAAHRKRRSAGLAAFQDALIDMPKPVVASLNGIASGGGAMIALLADARVAADTASLSLPEINLSIATFTGAAIAAQLGGQALATDLVQSGRRMPAAEALARGLLSAAVAQDALEEETLRVAASLAEKDPKTFAANKEYLNRGMKAALALARMEHEKHRKA